MFLVGVNKFLIMNYKKTINRGILWCIGLSVLLLIDEWIKEGYLIKLSDFIKPLTHENLLLMLLALLIVQIIIKKRLR